MSKRATGEPPRKRIPQQNSKPILVVADDDDLPAMDGRYYLAWHKPTGMFYVGGTGEPWNKTNLKTRDRLIAIFRFRDWVRQQSPDAVTLVDRQPPTLDGKPLEYNDATESYVLPPEALPGGGGTITIDCGDWASTERISVRSVDFWRTVREAVLSDPETFRKETGLRVTDERPRPSAALSRILDLYLNGTVDEQDEGAGVGRAKKAKGDTITPDERRKVIRYWNFFVGCMPAAKTVADVDAEALTRFEDAVWEIMDDGSPKTAHHYFEYPMRLLRYARGKNLDPDECSRVREAMQSGKADLPPASSMDSHPIPADAFHQLLDAADLKWKAILLTALNLCYYGCDIRRLRKDAIDWDKGWVVFDRIKAAKGDRKPVARVGVLWDRTKQALIDYLESSGHQAEQVFITQYGKPYTAQGLRTAFRFLREDKAGLGKEVELAHIRDGAYTAAVQGGAAEIHCKILAGHKVAGMSDAYIKRNPAMVADATDSIEAHYFPTKSQSKARPKAKKGPRQK